jgi:uroporphyrinogen decarboxylase
MRQAGRYLPEYRALRARASGFVEFCLTPELAAEATLQPVRRFGMDAAILFADILLIPQVLGQRVEFGEDGPVLDPLVEGTGIAGLRRKGFSGLDPVYETVRRCRAALSPETALIGFAGAPWTVATYMVEGGSSRDFRLVKTWAYRDPGGFAELIGLIVDATVDYLSGQIAAVLNAADVTMLTARVTSGGTATVLESRHMRALVFTAAHLPALPPTRMETEPRCLPPAGLNKPERVAPYARRTQR